MDRELEAPWRVLLWCLCLCVAGEVRGAQCLERVEWSQDLLTCGQGVSNCTCTVEDVFLPELDPEGPHVVVTRLDVEPLLCCQAEGGPGRHCRLCLRVRVTLSVGGHPGVDDQSGEDDLDSEAGSGLESQTASVQVCIFVPHRFIPCKKLHVKLTPAGSEGNDSREVHVSLVSFPPVPLGSDVWVVTNAGPNTSLTTNLTLPGCPRDGQWPHMLDCEVPTVCTGIHRETGEAFLQLVDKNIRPSNKMGVCLKQGRHGVCQFHSLNQTELRIPLYSVTPCLCFEVWWMSEADKDSVRHLICPFENNTELQQAMWNNLTLSVSKNQTRQNRTALFWSITTPCQVEAELWQCRGPTSRPSDCQLIKDRMFTGWQQAGKSQVLIQRTGEFPITDSDPSPCLMASVKGIDRPLGPKCLSVPVARGPWSLLVPATLLLLTVAVLGSCLLQGALKGWVSKVCKREDIRGAVGGGQVVLLYPPEADEALAGRVCCLGSALAGLGFSVSLDLWSRAELCALGPVPWLHSRLSQLQKHGGKVVLILSRAAWERAESWAQGGAAGGRSGMWGVGERDGDKEPGAACSSPYTDVFSASLSCIFADYLQGRAGERFVLAQLEPAPLPPIPSGSSTGSSSLLLPEIFRGLPLYSLPSQSLGFLTEISTPPPHGPSGRCRTPSRGRRAAGLRAASRALAGRLRGVWGASEAGYRLSGCSRDSCVSAGLSEEMWETVPLQPGGTPPHTHPPRLTHWV
ncbi:interleukin-17 receptor C isoform X2 [Amia ocellicauda]|uniref:interleukin-17 receptor C isoform X2 n=1 Tax=Amia ocellicauda TaxID=2972642 RepID=UPI0034643F93